MNAKMRNMVVEARHNDDGWHRNVDFYGFIKPRPNGEFTLTVCAINETKRYGIRVSEVNRAWSDRPYYVCKDVWQNIWGQFGVEWDERRNRPNQEGQWYRGRWGSRVYWSKAGGYWYAPYVTIVNPEALADTRYKYCGWAQYKSPMSLVEYTTLWKKHPHIEMLSKAGLSRFVTERICARLERDRGFASFVRSHAAEIAQHRDIYRPQVVARAYKNRWSLDKAFEVEKARYMYSLAPKGVDRIALGAYLTKNDIDYYDYLDYCRDVVNAKEDILSFGVTFPKDFHKARVKMQKRIKIAQAKADKERQEALKAVARRINEVLEKMAVRLAWRVGDFSVVMPVTRADFQNEGRRMHNCIGGYFNSCADGDTLCFFLNRGGRRVADVEVSPSSGKMLQCRAKFNHDTDAETRKFAAEVGRRYAAALRREKAKNAA